MKAMLEFKSDVLPISTEYIKNHFALSEKDHEIRKLLQIAIEHIELQNSITLQKKIWKIAHDNNYIVLGFGPITKLLSITDSANNQIKPLSIKRAHDNLIIQMADTNKTYYVRYEAGYDENTLPDCLKNTIVEKFWELFSQNFEVANDSYFDKKIDNKFKDYEEVMYEKYAFKY